MIIEESAPVSNPEIVKSDDSMIDVDDQSKVKKSYKDILAKSKDQYVYFDPLSEITEADLVLEEGEDEDMSKDDDVCNADVGSPLKPNIVLPRNFLIKLRHHCKDCLIVKLRILDTKPFLLRVKCFGILMLIIRLNHSAQVGAEF